MKSVAGIATLVAIIAGRAEADTQWGEYTYPDQQFAAAFPAPPKLLRIEGDADHRVAEAIYYVTLDSTRFQVSVFDLLRTGIKEPAAIANAVATLRENSEVKIDIVAEVQGHWGHYLNLETSAARRIVAGVFFRNDRLYEIEASAPASEFEAVSSDFVRFQQSLRFIGTLRNRRTTPLLPQNLGGRLLGTDGSRR